MNQKQTIAISIVESAKRFATFAKGDAPTHLITREASILIDRIMRFVVRSVDQDVGGVAKRWLKENEAAHCTCGKDPCLFPCGYCLAKGVAEVEGKSEPKARKES